MVAKRSSSGATAEEDRARAQALALVTVQYKNWDVVWSRMAGYPWWPGIVFLDWDVVRDAELPLPKGSVPPINPPEQREVFVTTAQGKLEARTITDHYCLVMFLDKGDWFVANMNVQVMPFTLGYRANAKSSHKRTKSPAFRLALQRAVRLFHTSPECSEEDLALLNTPPQKKRLRLDTAFKPLGHASSHGASEWDAAYVDYDHADGDVDDVDDDDGDEDFEIEDRGRSAKASSSKALRKPSAGRSRSTASARKLKHEPVDVAYDGVADAKVVPTGKSRKKLAAKATSNSDALAARGESAESVQKRASGKASSQHRDGGNDDNNKGIDTAGKRPKSGLRQSKVKSKAGVGAAGAGAKRARPTAQKKKGVRAAESISDGDDDGDGNDGDDSSDEGGVEFIENPNVLDDDNKGDGDTGDNDGGMKTSDAQSCLSNTPLSKIWTTHAEPAAAREDLTALGTSDTVKTLVHKQDFVWDESVFTSNNDTASEKRDTSHGTGTGAAGGNGEGGAAAGGTSGEASSPMRERPLGKRQMRSVQQSQIRQGLMMGNLDPHTMVQCESYRARDESGSLASRGRSSALTPPFRVQVHPDAVFVCDLHAHLATCEIIGFLGGRWCDASKTLYIQAAFPCRSLMIDGDDGSTDVEMDPGSEIELREIIQNAQLEVVGWYHSHPAFAPDPSIRDIENQTSYQQLFQRRSERSQQNQQPQQGDTNESYRPPGVEVSEPFVGLIVGTYDTKRESPVGLFRYFHTRGEKVSGGARREIYMPYELVPTRRQYRSVVRAERRAAIAPLAMYPSVYSALFGARSSVMRAKSVALPGADRSSVAAFTGIDVPPAGSGSADSVDAKDKVSVAAPAAVADALSSTKKRKPSVNEVATAVVKDEKPVKRRRGRPRTKGVSTNADSSRIDLTGDDVEPETATVAAATASAAVMDVDGDATQSLAADAKTLIVVDGDESSTLVTDAPSPIVVIVDGDASAAAATTAPATDVQASLSDTKAARVTRSAAYSQRLRGARKAELTVITVDSPAKADRARRTPHADSSGAIVIIDDPAVTMRSATSEKTANVSATAAVADRTAGPTTHSLESASSSAQSSPPDDESKQDDFTPTNQGLNGSAGSRRRGRKPAQTVRRPNMKTVFSSSTGDDATLRGSQRAAESTHIAVYGAFGSTSGVSVSGSVEHECASATLSSQESTASSSGAVNTSASSEGKYVYLQFGERLGVGASGAVAASTRDDAFGSNLIVLDSLDEVVAASQSSVVSVSSGDDASAAATASGTGADEVVPESQSPPVKSEATANKSAITETVKSEAVEMVKTEMFETPQQTRNPPAPVIIASETPVSESQAPAASVNEVRKVLADMCEAVVAQVSASDGEDEAEDEDGKAKVQSVTDSASGANPGSVVTPLESLSATEVARAVAEPTSVVAAFKEDPQQSDSRSVKAEHHSDIVTGNAAAVDAADHVAVAIVTADALKQETAAMTSANDAAVATPLPAKAEKSDDTVVAIKTEAVSDVRMDAAVAVVEVKSDTATQSDATASIKLFGSGRQVEDIRTSLAGIEHMILEMRCAQQQLSQSCTAKAAAAAGELSAATKAAADGKDGSKQTKPDDAATAAASDESEDLVARWEARLHSLRTKYGNGISGCAEQVITLVDYYRDFERRIDLNEPWRARVSKLRKIEASMREYVQFVNVPVQLRGDFVEDIVAYLQLSWELSRPGR